MSGQFGKDPVHEVVIDGVMYVPVMDVSVDAKHLLRALVNAWWGDWDPEYVDNPKYYRELAVSVNDDGEGSTLEDFVATLVASIQQSKVNQ